MKAKEETIMEWIQAAPVSELRETGRALVRRGKRQNALFSIEGEVFAIDNRCPSPSCAT